jgi:hypothetical protein
MGRRERAKLWLIGWDLERFEGIWVLEEFLEKGCTRKCTGNRVTRWRYLFWRNSRILCWIAKRMDLGELRLGFFWVLSVGPRRLIEEGGQYVLLFLCVGEILRFNWVAWGNKPYKLWSAASVCVSCFGLVLCKWLQIALSLGLCALWKWWWVLLCQI